LWPRSIDTSELDCPIDDDDDSEHRLKNADSRTIINKLENSEPFTVLDVPSAAAIQLPLFVHYLAENVMGKASLSQHRDAAGRMMVIRSAEQLHEHWLVLGNPGAVTGLHADAGGSGATLMTPAGGYKMVMLVKMVGQGPLSAAEMVERVKKVMNMVNDMKYDELSGLAEMAVVYLRPGCVM
jgi:hypothetical protein